MGSDISAESLFKANAQVVSCELDEGAALLDLRSNIYYGLNPVAAEIWAALQEPMSVSAVCGLVNDKFETGGADISSDVAALLTDMMKAGLVSSVDATSS